LGQHSSGRGEEGWLHAALRGPLPYLVAGMLMLGALATAVLVVSHRASRQAVATAEHLTQAVATGLAEQATRALQTVDLVLADMATRRRGGATDAVPPDLALLAAELPQLRAVLVIDAEGTVRGSSAPLLLGQRLETLLDLAALRRGADWARLGPPVPGRMLEGPPGDFAATRIWTIPMTRRIAAPDGTFLGAAVALLNPDYLGGIARAPAEAFGVLVRFHSFDGVLLARSDRSVAEIGVRRSGSWMFRDRLPRRETGSFTGHDGDGSPVTASLAVTRDVPLVVEVAQAEAVALQAARDQDMLLAAASGLVGIVMVGAMLLLLRGRQLLAAKEREARAATRAKDEFLAAMSH